MTGFWVAWIATVGGLLLLPWLWLAWHGGRGTSSAAAALQCLWTYGSVDEAPRTAPLRALVRAVAASALDLAAYRPRLHGLLAAHAVYLLVGPWFAGHFLHAPATAPMVGLGTFHLWGLRLADGTVVRTLDTWAVAFLDWVLVHAPVLLYVLLRHGRATRPGGPLRGALAVTWRTPAAAAPTARPVGALLWAVAPVARSAYVWLAWAQFAVGALELGTLYGRAAVLLSPAKAWWALVLPMLLVQQPRPLPTASAPLATKNLD